MEQPSAPRRRTRRKVRYGVVGLGHIAQVAVLPAFPHARRNSTLGALVSSDDTKLRKLGQRYGVKRLHGYEAYDGLLKSGDVDTVYLTLPNHLHASYAIRAAEAGVHVLVEKPMAVTERECRDMIAAASGNDVRLMVAYRLHFEPANLRAAELVRERRLGTPRLFNSVFTQQVKAGDIRLRQETGGGTLYDVGVYCINAVRYLFGAEPVEATAFAGNNGEERFRDVDTSMSAVLRYPGDRLASFTVSFGTADTSEYRVIGTEGDLRLEPAYDYSGALRHHLTVDGKTSVRTFRKRDQFAPEILYFSDCIREGREPEPSAREGLADVRIIEALLRSAELGRPVPLEPLPPGELPGAEQAYEVPAVEKPGLVHTESPTR